MPYKWSLQPSTRLSKKMQKTNWFSITVDDVLYCNMWYFGGSSGSPLPLKLGVNTWPCGQGFLSTIHVSSAHLPASVFSWDRPSCTLPPPCLYLGSGFHLKLPPHFQLPCETSKGHLWGFGWFLFWLPSIHFFSFFNLKHPFFCFREPSLSKFSLPKLN